MDIHVMQTAVSRLGISWNSICLSLRRLRINRKFQATGLLSLLSMVAQGASVTINGPTAFQAEVIALTTTTYNATVTPSSFFPGSYSINLISRKPAAPPVCPATAPCELDKDVALIVENSSNTYVYGFANGMQYERQTDLNIIMGDAFKTCVTTTTTSCSDSLLNVRNAIFQQNFSTPTVISVP